MLRQSGNIVAGVAVLGILLAGCDNSKYQTAPVTGTVMCDGKPAWGGRVLFRPVDAPSETGRPPGEAGRMAYAVVQADGTFEMQLDKASDASHENGALIGPHDVVFELPRTEPAPIDPDQLVGSTPEQIQKIRDKLDKLYPVFDPIPCGTEITPNHVTVVPGENNFQFTISAGRQQSPPRASKLGF